MSVVSLHQTPSRIEAQKILRELVAKGRVSLSRHAKERMLQRKINMSQVLTCLAKGKVTEDPVLANKSGDSAGYDLTVERLVAGDYLRVGVCLRFSQMIMIITAIKIK